MATKIFGQDARVCARPACDKPLTHGKFYCSNTCSAADRRRLSAVKKAQGAIPPIVEEQMPGAANELISILGAERAVMILQEFGLALQENKTIVRGAPPLKKGVTESGLPDSRYGTLTIGNKEYRARDQLSYDTIDDMLKNGQVVFTLAIKQAAIHSVLRNEGSWRVVGESERAKKMIKGMANRIFHTHGKEMMEFMPYGSAFFEKEWELRQAQEWGIKETRGEFWGYSKLAAIHPRSIKWINYTDEGHKFDGFTQDKIVGGETRVETEKALVLTYDKKFRNLWGNPATTQMYPYWFWLEVCWRAFLRYLERTGTPPCIVYGPSTGYVLTADGERVQSMKYALAQAGYISFSNAAAFPSDADRDSGKELWRVDYLETQARGDQFIIAIEQLGTMLARSVVIGDRAATQTGDAGGYNIAAMHWNVTQLHNQMVLDELIEQNNKFVVDPLLRYNIPRQEGSAYIETQTLDQFQQERLFKLLNTMGNQQGSTAMERVNWGKVLEINDIPVLSPEEVDKQREDQLKKAVDQQTAFAKVASETGQPLRKKDGSPPKQQQKPGQEDDKVQQSIEWIQYQLVNGTGVVPMYVTAEQAHEMIDRMTKRGAVFDFGEKKVELELDSDVDKIVKQVLSEIDLSDATKEEIEKLKEYILGLLGIEENGVERKLQYGEVDLIELGIGSFLKKAFQAAKKFVSKVVKKVTGKDLSEWKQAIGGKGKKKYTSKVGTVVVTRPDGASYVWDPKDHPRDADGKFSKSGASKSPVLEPEPEPENIPDKKAPGNGRSLAEAEKILADNKINVEVYGDFPAIQKELTIQIIADVISGDDYLSNTNVKSVYFVKDGEAFLRDKPLSGLNYEAWEATGMIEGAAAFWNPILNQVIILGGSADMDNEAFSSILVHELYHGIKVGERHGVGTSAASEEATTTLLGDRYVNEKYGYEKLWGYEKERDGLVRVLHLKNDGDEEKIWKDIEVLHSRSILTVDARNLIKAAGLKLTPLQMATFTLLAGPTYGSSSDGYMEPYAYAIAAHEKNTGESLGVSDVVSTDIVDWMKP